MDICRMSSRLIFMKILKILILFLLGVILSHIITKSLRNFEVVKELTQ